MSFPKRKLELSTRAQHDIRSILAYTSRRWGKEQRHRYRHLLDAGLKRIAENPGLGLTHDPATPSILHRMVEHHIVFYELVSEDAIVVLRILHERMDLTRWETVEWKPLQDHE